MLLLLDVSFYVSIGKSLSNIYIMAKGFANLYLIASFTHGKL